MVGHRRCKNSSLAEQAMPETAARRSEGSNRKLQYTGSSCIPSAGPLHRTQRWYRPHYCTARTQDYWTGDVISCNCWADVARAIFYLNKEWTGVWRTKLSRHQSVLKRTMSKENSGDGGCRCMLEDTLGMSMGLSEKLRELREKMKYNSFLFHQCKQTY